MAKFTVHVSRTVFENRSIEVEADDEEAAEALALEKAEKEHDEEWSGGEVESYYVSEVEGPGLNPELEKVRDYLRQLAKSGLTGEQVTADIFANIESGTLSLVQIVLAARELREDPEISPIFESVKMALLSE